MAEIRFGSGENWEVRDRFALTVDRLVYEPETSATSTITVSGLFEIDELYTSVPIDRISASVDRAKTRSPRFTMSIGHSCVGGHLDYYSLRYQQNVGYSEGHIWGDGFFTPVDFVDGELSAQRMLVLVRFYEDRGRLVNLPVDSKLRDKHK